MTKDGVRISNLEGTVRAFATAADQNNNGIVEKGVERNIFDRLINESGLSLDDGLQVERQRLADDGEKTPKAKKQRRKEKRTYKAYFGKGKIDEVKTAEGEANRRVGEYYRDSKSVDKKSDEEINRAISGRPDMPNYSGDAEGYKIALHDWADSVKDAGRMSLIDTFKKTVKDCSDELAEEMDKLSQEIFDALNEQEKAIIGSTQDIAADVVGYVNDHADEVAADLKDNNKRNTIFSLIMNRVKAKIQERIQIRREKSAQTLGDS